MLFKNLLILYSALEWGGGTTQPVKEGKEKEMQRLIKVAPPPLAHWWYILTFHTKNKHFSLLFKCVFYWVLVSAGFQATWFLTGKKCPRSLVKFYVANLYMKMDKTSWAFLNWACFDTTFTNDFYLRFVR